MAKRKKLNYEAEPVSLVTMYNQTSPVAEQYRTIRTNILFSASADQRIKTIVITSSGPEEGKSTTAANLAVVFANSGQRTLLVDADMRKPTVHKTFGLDNKQGLSTLLSTSIHIKDVLKNSDINNLTIMTCGIKPPNPSELLGTARFDSILGELKLMFDVVIFDMPPVVTVTDAQIVSSKTDGTLLVVRENVTKKESALKAKELLALIQANVIGVIYNGSKSAGDKGYYYYGN